MMQELAVFNNPAFGEIRTLQINCEPWFIGKDITEKLEYRNGSRDINRHVDIEDKMIIPIFTDGQYRNTIIINESGLYALIFGSKLEKAKQFKRWVTSEVLPTIRKTGSYGQIDYDKLADVVIDKMQLKKNKPVKAICTNRWYDSYIDCSNELTELMIIHNISDRKLGAMTGISFGSIRNYRVGSHRCSPERYKIIMNVLNNL